MQKLSVKLKNIPRNTSLVPCSINPVLNRCKDCNEILVPSVNWYLSNIRGSKGNLYLCKKCGIKRRIVWGRENKGKERINRKTVKIKLKSEVICQYGNKCSCCGETNIEFLTIDHINGGGNKHKRDIKKNIYRWLKHNNYPDGFQVLCYNCNLGKNRYNVCPHNKNKFLKEINKSYQNGKINSNSVRKSLSKLRMDIIKGYGSKCEICGEANSYFLTIHHKFKDGNIERKEGNWQTLYRRLRKENFPNDRYQLLCFNCNCSERFRNKI